ncbi:MAG: crotonase/enoyl-CoA hydratase family protein [Burkholderiaceae bacterium]|nr:crotonase/enoyl-CoA hydratase family protein [Burkholderiaceae bacterium]
MSEVSVVRDGPVTILTLSRPEARNAVDGPTAQALASALEAFDADAAAHVAVFQGANGHFCAGADLRALADESRRNRIEAQGSAPMGPTRMLLSKPVIAAISGYAVAGGLELALWCDLRVVERSAILGVFCRRFGVPLIDGGTVRLARLIGLSRALDLILTGRAIAADEALAFGLANRVVPDGAALGTAVEIAHELARFPQTCMRNDRLSAYEQFSMTLEEALANEFVRGRATIDSGETLGGAAAFAAGAGRHGTAVVAGHTPGSAPARTGKHEPT